MTENINQDYKNIFLENLIIIILLFIGNMFVQCEKEELSYVEFNVVVYGKGLDCGDLFLLKFSDNLDALYQITGEKNWQIFYAYGLDEKFKVKDVKLSVKIRKPTKDEIFACTTLGISYPWITIITAKNRKLKL